jgi:hypothetical protein
MRVLDLDLDFFLDKRVESPPSRGRPSPADVHPWRSCDIEEFLVKQCGLDPRNPLPGRAVVEHHELFDVWKDMVARGQLIIPFDLVHVDAHADMGMGDGSPSFIMAELLHRDVAERTSPPRGGTYGLLEGNYLAFAVACRWIRSLTYVVHPHLYRDNCKKHDIPDCFFKNYDNTCNCLQQKALAPESLRSIRRPQEFEPVHLEPEIAIRLVSGSEFKSESPFSLVFAAQSPRYTPSTADEVFSILRRFIQ